ncbi:ShlB/FhaC/HecB family hemolysin secretion/activation protein [bacterium]|nr:ShlB/FhaC/HecB family hemolysin secretion/activation protein [bacterium]
MIHKVNDPFQKLATAGIIARFAALAFAVNGAFLLNASGQMEEPPPLEEVVKSIDAGRPETFYIREFRIVGAKKLPQDDVDAAVYNRLGKGRTPEDVEGARVALEKAYHDKGYQTVSVTVPPQSVTSGVIVMQVSEVTVGRLTVKGSRFFDIEKIKKMAPSLAEGNVPNFNDIQQDIMGLNQQADCQVTPSLTAGKIPGTVDVELTVKDKFPLHGSVELNNRYSANTTPLRLDAAVRYDNLWQWGHTIGGAFQIAPQRPSDALIYSGYYIARTPSIDWLSLMLSATRQNSEVSTLGGSSSLGNGEIYGGKFLVNLPSKKGFYHSASLGLDYKDFAQDLVVNDQIVSSPLTYWPFSLNYNASSIGKHYQTEFNAGVTFAFRGTGTEEAIDFDNRRYNASANFFYLRGGIEHTQKLAWDFQIVGGLQGQATANPLVDTEQFSLGGLSTVRGYLESSVVGDNAVCGTLELRTPSLLGWLPEGNEWRFFAFIDAGYAMLNDPLPEQVDHFTLWSIGVGTSLRLIEHVNGEFLIGIPQVTQSPSQAGQPLFTFRVSLEL